MVNVGIFDGDVILVKQQNTARNGEIVAASLMIPLPLRLSTKKLIISAYSRKMILWSQLLLQTVRFSV